VATVTLDRPDKLNAITDAMWDELAAHLKRSRADDAVRVVVLTGAGRGFCAGADISGEDRKIRRPGLVGALEAMDSYNAVIGQLYHLPKPVIAAVRGPVAGIAWTLALCCDWVLASPTTTFRPVFLNLAKVPEGGILLLMSRKIGDTRARDILYRSRTITGEEAVALGLASRLVDDADLMQAATDLALEMTGAAPTAFALTKQLFTSSHAGFDEFVAAERNAIAIAANLEDAREGMTAFREKRTAQYVGQ
jgi:2-(1,2-epoxy-1,2-dihydrophenyl)acetyl-CoA isomerase